MPWSHPRDPESMDQGQDLGTSTFFKGPKFFSILINQVIGCGIWGLKILKNFDL